MVKRHMSMNTRQLLQMNNALQGRLQRYNGNGIFDSLAKLIGRATPLLSRVGVAGLKYGKMFVNKLKPIISAAAPLLLKAGNAGLKSLVKDKAGPALIKELAKNKNKLGGVPDKLLAYGTDALLKKDGLLDMAESEISKGVKEWANDSKKKSKKPSKKLKASSFLDIDRGLQSNRAMEQEAVSTPASRLKELRIKKQKREGSGMKKTKKKKGSSLYTFNGSSLYGF